MFSEGENVAKATIPLALESAEKNLETSNENEKARRSSSDTAISVRGISKCYQIYDAPRDRLKQFIIPRLRLARQQSRQYFREFWALKGISFEVRKGETVGIIGRNGSGKSTLLQIICGTLTPTAGSVETRGRIAALLELGSGFNPEFTGRENIYMNGAVLGLTREEIDDRFDSIVSFADIGQFIDQPVKTYSSGMSVRLAFAVQAQVDPDILIVDEALSVGDVRFQAKCFARLQQLKDNGTSVLLVTHSSEQIVTHCSSALLLNDGMQFEIGEPRHVVNRYLDLLFGKERRNPDSPQAQPGDIFQEDKGYAESAYQLSTDSDVFQTRNGYNTHEYRWGDGTASILDFYLAANGEPYPSAITVGQTVTLAVSIKFHSDMWRPILGITIKTKDGVTISGTNSEMADLLDLQALVKKGAILVGKCSFQCRLGPGDYFVSLGLATRENDEIIPHDRRYDSIHFIVEPHNKFHGLADLALDLSISHIVESNQI
ncbi:lipopolysaccharide transport system ATP-binding protein [Nitrosospira multiformis ATCC 25196]|uniref:ABC transporter related protein n=1 Tax=Nitrosospira multiformis (strain ATCC 25196 / NCIMB 11849 / C 71) TaxID=323848 RepID=Q2Y6D4_NITMU|nr:ABC transporter ATP-binding protein [Nitrosospira multiformis]ABB75687.1 ABC transporter related protein [Nitrosospira multiformis ATCC 25196]SEG17803.1 lipopolysaccharide transport system ATP-binding protein [Nitrosospira multiformis ATCC 25196]